MSGRTHKHALERLNFAPNTPVAERTAACKTFIRLESAMIRMRHDAGESGLAIVHARSAMFDVMLRHLFDFAIGSWAQNPAANASGTSAPFMAAQVALLAVGGYGRREQSPHSDIDLMFLFPPKMKANTLKAFQAHLVNEILYVLWDCKLKVGHSSRTTDDAFAEARRDIQNKTALLESRLVAGSQNLYDSFAPAYENFYRNEDPRGYIRARLEDQASRRRKYDDSVFVQEPDIKNGVGGLRDYQNCLWMARVKLGITTTDELAAQNYLQRNEARNFIRAYDFLLRTRNEVHFTSKLPTDLLNLEAQPRIALGLGYTHTDPLGRVEHFMRDYYRAAQIIHRTTKILEKRLALTLESESRLSFRDTLRALRFQRTKRIDGFIVRGSELCSENDQVFRQDPDRLIRVFRHAQQLDAAPDFHLQALIRQSLPLLTKRIQFSPAANISFRAILNEAGAVYPTLELMHELGVLGRFIPEFDGLTCLVQHELYHRYTADVHTLLTIRELDRILTEVNPVASKYREILHETPDPTLLYLILLLHDIGKAEGIQGHAESGVRIALPIMERLGLDPASRETVTFIIKNHLIMARFWQRHDIDDPKSAAAFAKLVPDADQLRYLYVHTYCDACGTASSLWNSYKDTLHTNLLRVTLDHLHHGTNIDTHLNARKNMKLQELVTQKIPGIGAEEISAHFGLLPERYFIQADTDEIALHIKMVNKLLGSISGAESVGSLRPVLDWKDDINRSLTTVNVVTWDRAGLFYKLAGAFSVAGLSILSAKIISRSDHIAIDTFHVVDPSRGTVQNSAATETFARTVEQALVANVDLYPEILAQAKKHQPRRFGADKGPALQASFPPTVEIYQELSMHRTIVEVQAQDQIGLLYRLAKTISDHNFDITFARISTERNIALDTFYIESAQPSPGDETERLHHLREALIQVIVPIPETAAAP